MAKNPAAVALGRLGGQAKTAAKKEAAKARALKMWETRPRKASKPYRSRKPKPAPTE